MQFLYVKIVAARQDYKRNTRAILVRKKICHFYREKSFQKSH